MDSREPTSSGLPRPSSGGGIKIDLVEEPVTLTRLWVKEREARDVPIPRQEGQDSWHQGDQEVTGQSPKRRGRGSLLGWQGEGEDEAVRL